MAFKAKTKRITPSKKRTGQHHRHSQVYLKHYWPYLPMLLVVVFGLSLSSLWSGGSFRVLGASTDLTSQSLLAATNASRSQYGEISLSLNDQLTAAAEAKANDMVHRNYWSHDTPSGQTPWSFITAAGYRYELAGENLAYGLRSADSVEAAWMNSPEHRANILKDGYSQVGFGVASSSDYVGQGPKLLVVAMYASPATTTLPALTQSTPTSGVKGVSITQAVPRIALMGGSGQLLSVAILALCGLAMVTFTWRHGRLLHRSLVRGEQFVVAHPSFDLLLVVVATAGYVVTRAAGFIM